MKKPNSSGFLKSCRPFLWFLAIAVVGEFLERSEFVTTRLMRLADFLPLLGLVFVGFLSYHFIPVGLRFLSNADKGSYHKRPLFQGQVIDILTQPNTSAHQYVVSFVDAAQQRAVGITQTIHSEPRYAIGSTIQLYIDGLQPVFPGSEPSGTPTYDVKLHDGITFSYDVRFRKFIGWLLVGIPGVFLLVTLSFALMRLLFWLLGMLF